MTTAVRELPPPLASPPEDSQLRAFRSGLTTYLFLFFFNGGGFALPPVSIHGCPTPAGRHASQCRHVVIRTLSLRNVFFWKAIFTRHPDLLERVLRQFSRVRRRLVFHRAFAGGGSGRGGITGPFPVMLL